MHQPSNLPLTTEEAMFAEALALPPAKRREFIERKCDGNHAEGERMMALLHGYAGKSAFLDIPAPTAALPGHWPDLPIAPEPVSGDRIGRYRIVERIGEGGFGIVYLADQEEPLRRRVALKLIRLGMDTREFIARFEAERQALALMDHPNIARVFDAGATENGRPYLVMECVDGIAITAYCDEHRLSLRKRLELFISVCSAIQHAHHKGVIHRDLKPSNILVAHEADAPLPKVIDFGIAKATSGPLTDKTLFTHHLALIGTPGYMSPEQMEINASEVDTRSDLYSLGAILYELLTGVPPFEREVLQRANFDELRRIVREVEPPRPSERVRRFTDGDRTGVAGRRGIDPAKLSAALASDLDWIVMRCLEKNPPQRYVTANALVVDLRRHLDNEPVIARPPSHSYRLRKFVHRHRTPVAAIVAVLISLFGGLLATGVLLVRERAAAEKSRQVAQFMKDMLRSIGPGVARGRDTTLLREVLDTTIQRLDTELRDQPDIAADLRHTLGVAAQAMGDYDRAAQLWRESIGTRRRLGDNQSAALAASLHELGIVLGRINQAADGENALEEALAIRRKTLGPEHFDVGTTLAALAYNLGSHRSEREREALAREAVRIQRKYPGHNDDAFAQSLMVLGYLLNSRNRYAEARTVLQESVAVGRTLPGVFNPQLADSLQMLVRVMSGRMFVASMRSSEELNLRREMLRLVQQGRGLAHSKLVAALMGFVSGPLPAETLVDDLLLVRGVLTDLRKVLPEDSPDLGVAELAVASAIDFEPGNTNEAASLAREAVSRIHRARAKGIPPHRDTSIAMQGFAWENYRDGRMPYALLMAEELNADLTFGSVLSYGVPMARALGYMYFDLGRLDESIALLEHNARSEQGRKRPLWRMVQRAHLLIDFACLGDAYRQQGRLVESRQVLEEGLARKFQTGEEIDPAMNARGAVRGELGYTAMAEGKFAEAEALFREALKEYDAGAVVNRWNNLRPRGRVVSGLGQALSGQGKILEAEALVVEGYLDLKTNRPTFIGDRSGMLREALDAVVQVYRTTGRPDKAMEWEQQRAEL